MRMKIRDIFERPIDRRIEEVIKVTQVDEEVVYNEISEYVVTDAIKEYFGEFLGVYSEAPSNPHESIGVWISGFFGSGKSSFAKILGYILEGKQIKREDVRELFKRQANDKRVSDFLDYIKVKIPTKAIVFDVAMDRGVRLASNRITEIMYKVLLRELGYAEDFDIAQLEQDLEEEGKLGEFINLYEKKYSRSWSKGRKRASALNEASSILYEMDPNTFNQPDSWVRSLGTKDEFGNIKGRADITPNELAKRAFDLMARRIKDTALVFIIDEVGQFVSRSVEKMLDLQAIVEALGVESKNRVMKRQAIAPIWLIVTSQEKLNEVVSALGDKKIEFARLKNRFPIEIDLSPADISEVTSKRILVKKATVIPEISKLFKNNQHRLNQCTKLERTSRSSETRKDNFISLYPYLPYHIELSIDIISGLRLQPGAVRYIGGSNRTIIKQAQQMLINPRVNLAEQELGTLVTLDKVYDLISGNISSEKQRDISNIENKFSDKPFVAKVVKVICLLEFARDLPRTPLNIAALLYSYAGAESCIKEVEEAIKILENAQFIKLSEEGYKLLTAQEKNWDIKRNELTPKPADRNLICREILEELFKDAKYTRFNYKNLKTFTVSYILNGKSLTGDGNIIIELSIAEDIEEFKDLFEQKKKESRQDSNKSGTFWVFSQSEEIHNLIEELYCSREMIRIHERFASQGQLTFEEHKCYGEEKIREDKVHRKLRNKIENFAYSGSIFFRGVKKDISSYGQTLSDSIRGLISELIPDLFPKFKMGAKHVSGKEAQILLTSIDLSGLSSIFYEGRDGFGFVVKQHGKYEINVDVPIAQEMMRYIDGRHQYGEKVTGKLLETHFGGMGYVWERDIIRLVLSVLFRAGIIEVSYQGRRYKNYTEAGGREAIINNNAFKIAAFMPREQIISPKVIKEACVNYEAITGKEIDAEENAIAYKLKELASQRKEMLLPMKAKTEVLNLPCEGFVENLLKTMTQILENISEDCVKFLAEEGKELEDNLKKVTEIEKALSEDNLKILEKARKVLFDLPFNLKKEITENEVVEKTLRRLRENTEAEDFYDRLPTISKDTEKILSLYYQVYRDVHSQRNKLYTQLAGKVKSLSEWEGLPSEIKNKILGKINSKYCQNIDLKDSNVCKNCRASIAEVNSDISAFPAVEQFIQNTIDNFIVKNDISIEKIRLSEYFDKVIVDEEAFKKQIEKFIQQVETLLKEKKKVIIEWG